MLQIFLKMMKIETESLYMIQQQTNFSKLWYSFRFSVKAFKLYHCHKLILSNQYIQNRHIPEVYSELCQTP